MTCECSGALVPQEGGALTQDEEGRWFVASEQVGTFLKEKNLQPGSDEAQLGIPARFETSCIACAGTIVIGDLIHRTVAGWRHMTCVPVRLT